MSMFEETSDRLANLSLLCKRFSSSALLQPYNKKLKQLPLNPFFNKNPKPEADLQTIMGKPKPRPSSKKLTYQMRKLIQHWKHILLEEERISKEKSEGESGADVQLISGKPKPSPSLKKPTYQMRKLIQQWEQVLLEKEQMSKEKSEREPGADLEIIRGKPTVEMRKLTRVTYEMRKLIQQWEQILEEKEEQKKPKGEAVSVEKGEDGSFLIQFNCSCKCSFQLLFSGSDCYYRICENNRKR